MCSHSSNDLLIGSTRVPILLVIPVLLVFLFVLLLLYAFISVQVPGLSTPNSHPIQFSINETGSPSYAQLCDPALTNNLTDAQAKAYMNKLRGTRVTDWQRYVFDVDSGLLGYRVRLSGDQRLGLWDTSIAVSENTALALTKGQLWQFSGIIDDGSVVQKGVCMFALNPH